MNVRSTLLSVVSIILLVVVVSFSDISAVFDYIDNNPNYLLLLVMLYLILFFLRLLRNYILFRVLGYTDASLLTFLPQGLIAGVVATYGPLKSGELLAVEIYETHFNIDRGRSLSVIVLGRIFDIVLVLLFVASAIYSFTTLPTTSLIVYLVLIVIILTIVIIFLLSEQLTMTMLKFIEPIFIGKFERLFNFIYSIAKSYYQGLGQIYSFNSISILFVFSITRWITELVFFATIFSSLQFGLNLLQVMPIVGFSYAIGVSSGTPGGLGTSQLTAIGILVLHGISASQAALALIIITSISILCSIVLASIGFISSFCCQYIS